MLGHRGCRLAITYPEILDMQIRALVAGLREAARNGVQRTDLEIMVPFVSSPREVSWMREKVFAILEREGVLGDRSVHIAFGTMIELPRAAMRAGDIAPLVDFFSFGTNDLTQATFSFSREDAENRFLPLYEKHKILEHNPFEELDEKSVGRLMQMTIEWGRKSKPDLKIGICGEHGGQPQAIYFCNKIGVTYVSCSPLRIPIARLSAAHAVLADKPVDKSL
jgi:pyruvate,orthophosphate dikinase